MNDSMYRIRYNKGGEEVYPTHPMVENWVFEYHEDEEATLASAMAAVAEKNGISKNDLHYLFPAVLRMMKSNTSWS